MNSIHEAFAMFDVEKTGKIASKDLKVFKSAFYMFAFEKLNNVWLCCCFFLNYIAGNESTRFRAKKGGDKKDH